MITYNELCKKYTDHQNMLSQRKDILRNELRDLVLAFEENLGLKGLTYIQSKPDGKHRLPYVDLLHIENRSSPDIIQPLQAPVAFENSKPYSVVGISLILEKDGNTYPKTRVYVPLKITLAHNNLLYVEFNEVENKPCFEVDTREQNKFKDVIEEIKASIMRNFEYE
ncbi:TPA: hypothetical protein QB250_000758 [Pasteurella multocida]|nr:hypothetical protein [Pasteurella multocida]